MDLKKLYWINGEHIKITPNEKLAELIKPRLALPRYLRHGKTCLWKTCWHWSKTAPKT